MKNQNEICSEIIISDDDLKEFLEISSETGIAYIIPVGISKKKIKIPIIGHPFFSAVSCWREEETLKLAAWFIGCKTSIVTSIQIAEYNETVDSGGGGYRIQLDQPTEEIRIMIFYAFLDFFITYQSSRNDDVRISPANFSILLKKKKENDELEILKELTGVFGFFYVGDMSGSKMW